MASLKENIASIRGLLDDGIMSQAEFEEQRDRYLAEAYREAGELLAKGDKESLLTAQDEYREMGDYLDAKSKLKLCDEKLAKLDKAEAAAQKKRKKIIAIVSALAVVAIGIFVVVWNATAPAREAAKAEKALDAIRSAQVGDIITFGSYEQDNDTSNGKEPIEWRVLAKSGNRMLVISVKALDCKQFNSSRDKGNDWGSSDLKRWLTGTFRTTAFSADELKMVSEVTCLSEQEANQYFKSRSDMECTATAYAKAQGAYVSNRDKCAWWLRSPGTDGSSYVVIVWPHDGVASRGLGVDNRECGVRPAIWVTIQ